MALGSEKIGEMYIELLTKMNRMEADMKKATRVAKIEGKKTGTGFGEAFKRAFAGLGIAIALKKIFDFTIILKNAARDGIEIRSKFDTVFSSMVEGANKVADAFSKEFKLAGATTRDLLGATGDLLVGFGFTEQAALDMSEQVNRLAQDLASFTNFSGGAKGASDALTKAILGETESAKALGIVIRQDTKEFKNQVKELMVMRGVTLQQAKSIAILKEAYKQSGKAVGDFERTQDSLANRERILDEQLKDLHETLGKELVPIFTDLVSTMQQATTTFSDFNKGLKEFTGLGDIEKGVGIITNLMNAISLSLGRGGFILDEYKKGLMEIEKTAKETAKEHEQMANSLNFARELTEQIVRASRNWESVTGEVVGEVQAIYREIVRLEKKQEEIGISLKEWRQLDADILAQKELLTGKAKEQVLTARELTLASKEYLETLKLITEQRLAFRSAQVDEDLKKPFMTFGDKPQPTELIDTSGMKDSAEILENAFEKMDDSTDNIDQKFISILNAGASLGTILEIGAHTFIGIMLAGLDKVNSVVNSIFGIISAFTGGGGGGLLGLIFGGATGGTFKGTGSGVKKMAGGGSFLVPNAGQSGDYFPLLLKGGEVANITPANKVIDNTRVLAEIRKGINNLNENMVSVAGGNSMPVNIDLSIDGRELTKETVLIQKQLEREGETFADR